MRGHEVFVPLSQLVGGADRAGTGWNMLNECLAVGRSITLPSTASGGAKSGARVTGAYARTVSYTHLDVYKRQHLGPVGGTQAWRARGRGRERGR